MKERCNNPIPPSDKQRQQSATHAKAENLPDQGQSLFVFTHQFALAPASHLSQRL